jgi:hypothetical protein
MKAGEIAKAVDDMEHKIHILEHELLDTKFIAFRLMKGDFTYALRDDEIEVVKSHRLHLSKENNIPIWIKK